MMNISRISLLAVGSGVLLLSGCLGTNTTPSAQEEVLAPEISDTMTTTPTLEQCQNTVAQHLENIKNLSIDNSKTVASNVLISVDYVGRLEDGSVFDTSVESVAQGCGLFTPQRDYTSGLEFTAGAGQMIAGFDEGVLGMAINESKTITIPADQAYGTDTMSIPLEELPLKEDGTSYKAGESIPTINGNIQILSIDEENFTIANTHPLAGKDLIFDITIKSIN